MATKQQIQNTIEDLAADTQIEFQQLNAKIDALTPTASPAWKALPWKVSLADAAKGTGDLKNGALAVMRGDTMGGTATILQGIGSISGLMALSGGPVGAILAGAMALLTSILSAILDAFKPAVLSLEQKIQMLLNDDALKTAHSDLVGDKAGWDQLNIRIVGLVDARAKAIADLEADDKEKEGSKKLTREARAVKETTAAGTEWAILAKRLSLDEHYQVINRTFDALERRAGKHSAEWMALFDLTIMYVMSYWLGYECAACLVDENSPTTFGAERRNAANTFMDHLARLYFDSLNESDFYHVWLGPQYGQAAKQNGLFGPQAGDPENLKELGGATNSIAVTPSGTIFSTGDNGLLYVGRGPKDNWVKAVSRESADRQQRCDQVFICEMPADDRGLAGLWQVVCLHDKGRKLSVCYFDDGVPRDFEDNPRAWTLKENRWGKWTTYDVPKKDVYERWIVSLAIDSRSLQKNGKLTLYAFITTQFGGNCIPVTLEENGTLSLDPNLGSPWMDMKEIEDAIKPYTLDREGWIGPVTVSCTRDVIYVQTGNSAKVFEREGNRKWVDWNMPDIFNDGNFKCYQVRGFEDYTLVGVSDEGARMTYGNWKKPVGSENWAWGLSYAKTNLIQSHWFTRQVSTQVQTAVKLQALLIKAISEEGLKALPAQA